MKQLSFLTDETATYRPEAKALARTSDPEPSRVAAEKMVKTGAITSHVELITNAIRAKGSSTCGEIAGYLRITERAEWYTHKVNKRTAEMVRDGLIVKVGERNCEIEENLMGVYALAGACCAKDDAQVVRGRGIRCRTCRRLLSGEGEVLEPVRVAAELKFYE